MSKHSQEDRREDVTTDFTDLRKELEQIEWCDASYST